MAADSPRRALRQQGRGLKASVGIVVTFRRDLLARWPLLLGALGCALAFAAVRLLEPWPLKYVFDNVLGTRPFDSPIPGLDALLAGDRGRILVAATVAILVLAGLRGMFYAYETLLATRVGQEVVLRLRRRLFARLQRHSLDFHAENSTGDLLTRLTSDVNMLRELLVGALLGIISESLVLIGFLVVMLVMEWRLAVVAIVAMPLVFGLVTAYSGRIRTANRKQRESEGQLAGRLEEVLSGIQLVQLFAREDDENERLRRLNKRSLRTGLESVRLEASMNRWVELSIALTTAITLWFGATQVIAGHMTPGDLIVFVAYMQSFYRPLRRISRVARRAAKAQVSVERIMDVLDRQVDLRDGDVGAPRLRGEVRLEGVSFAYGGNTPVLHDLDLIVPAGSTIAIVGPTGAGKSTLLGLVPRLRDATAGVVRVDGYDVRELTLKSLRGQVAVVPQEGMLFGGTVRENIAYGKPDATDAEIEAAARAALIHDFVASLPDGYETELAERGVTFSGGQRQRLAIARAIVKDAPIVLLDEPTTGLDAESEHLTITALERLLDGRTALVIAHRLSTIRRADAIVVLGGGRIVERGTHAELLALGGTYRRLHDLQVHPGRTPVSRPAEAAPAAAPLAPAARSPESRAPSIPPKAPPRRRSRGIAARLATRLFAALALGGAIAGLAAERPGWPPGFGGERARSRPVDLPQRQAPAAAEAPDQAVAAAAVRGARRLVPPLSRPRSAASSGSLGTGAPADVSPRTRTAPAGGAPAPGVPPPAPSRAVSASSSRSSRSAADERKLTPVARASPGRPTPPDAESSGHGGRDSSRARADEGSSGPGSGADDRGADREPDDRDEGATTSSRRR